MTERWKPTKGEMYFYISNVLMVADDVVDGYSHLDEERIAAGNCFATYNEAEAAAEKVKALLRSLQDNGETLQPDIQDKKLPKLTAEVFDRPDCPAWAKWAAVSANGFCYFFEKEPSYGVCNYKGKWYVDAGRSRLTEPLAIFDASDWQNSLIERPAKLPDWCKVGEWLWLDPQKIYGPAGYKKIKNIDGLELTFADGCCIYFSHKIKQARPRPYNAEEMKALVGKPITLLDGTVCLCTAYSKRDNSVILDSIHWDAQELLGSGYTIDNKPCGKLEHLEAEEWVE